MTDTAVGRYFPVLGTEVVITVEATDAARAHQTLETSAAELHRLQSIFTIYDMTSPLSRWAQEHVSQVPPELSEVLRRAQEWFTLSGGAFHPVSAGLRRRWLKAEDAGVPPTPQEMQELASELSTLPFTVEDDGTVHRTGDCRDVDLNAVAKGFILDAVAHTAMDQPDTTRVVVDAGSDVRHLGQGQASVAIGEPEADDAEPGAAATVTVVNAGLSTSSRGGSQFLVGGRRFPALLDPTTGWPVSRGGSVTVRAGDAITADVLATVLEVTDDEGAARLLQHHPEAVYLRITADGALQPGPGWTD